MFDRLSRSWRLVKASAAVLRHDHELLLFPLFSSIALVLVLLSFAVPVVGLGLLEGVARRGEFSGAMYVVVFLFYVTQYFVMFYFNAALVGAAMVRMDGGDPTLGDGLRIANGRLGAILGYALIAATVGMILKAIQERVGFIGRIVVGLLGAGWTIATFMVVPVLVATKSGPIEAVKQSASLLRKTWGENLIGQGGIGMAFGFIFLVEVLFGIGLVIVAFASGSIAVIVVALALLVLVIGITGLLQSALAGIYSAALYRYATRGEDTAGFDGEALRLAFAPR